MTDSVRQKFQSGASERGFVLLSVVLGITLIALVAFMIGNQTTVQVTVAAGELQRDELRYVAEAGLAHAQWQLAQNTTCTGYANLASTNFGSGSYSATVTPVDGSPISVSTVGTLANGISMSLSRDSVKVFQASNTVVLQPGSAGDDAEIWDQAPNNNYGDSAETWVSSAKNDTTRSLLRFDTDAIPSNVLIKSAILSLRRQSGSGTNASVSAHRITNQWSEVAATWNSRESGTSWDTAGGDFESAAVATTPIDQGNQRYEWNITPLMQNWVDGSDPNFGLALVAASGGMTGERFYTGDEGDAARHPNLTVTYACECGATCTPQGSTLPIAHWKLDEMSGANALDFVGGNDGELINGPSWVGGILDGGLLFDGDNDYVDVSSMDPMQYDDFTISAWYRSADLETNEDQYIFMHIDDYEDAITFGPTDDAGNVDRLRLSVYDGSSEDQHFGTSDIVDNQWHHVVAVRSAGRIKLYVDGVEETDEIDAHAGSTVNVNGDGPFIGDYPGQTEQVDGALDDVRLYDVALTASEVYDLFAAASRGPIAHWKMNDGSGSTALDSEGGHDGELIQGPAWVSSGKLGGALQFDGIDDYVEVPHDDTLSLTSALTISAWVRNDSAFAIDSYRILSKESVGSNDNFWLSLQNRFLWFGVGGDFFSPGTSLNPNQWYHVAASFDDRANEVLMYIDGAQVLRQSTTATIVPNEEHILIGGNWEGLKYWDGLLDDVRLYDRVLTPLDVSNLFGAGLSSPISHWKLDDGAGTTAIDSVGDNDGKLVNGPQWNDVGQANGSLEFDEVNDYAQVSDFEIGTDFTLSFGFKIDDNTGSLFQYIYSHGDINSVNSLNIFVNEASHGTDPNVLRTVIRDSNDDLDNFALQIDVNSIIGDGSWHTYTLTVANGTGAVVYLDGVQQNSDARGGGSFDPATDVYLGARQDVNVDRLYGGSLDEVRIYDYALGAAEVYALAGGPNDGGGGGGGDACVQTFADDFESADYSGNTGSESWSFDWQEFGDDGSPNGGDERVQSFEGNWELRVRDNNGGGEGVYREADTSGAEKIVLTIEYWRYGLDRSSDYVALEVSPNGGSDWKEIDRFEGEAIDDGVFTAAVNDISDFISSNMQIRLITSPTMGNTDEVLFDNIEICVVK